MALRPTARRCSCLGFFSEAKSAGRLGEPGVVRLETAGCCSGNQVKEAIQQKKTGGRKTMTLFLHDQQALGAARSLPTTVYPALGSDAFLTP